VIVRTANTEAPAPFFRRFIAAIGVALVLMLATATVTPAFHDWLHVEGDHETNHQCAVVLFASGVALAAGAIALTGPTLAWRIFSAPAAAELFLVVPRYLRQPERGPPAC
jgi:hypothetical protein